MSDANKYIRTGVAHQCDKCASYFLRNNTMVKLKEQKSERATFLTDSYKLLRDEPLAVTCKSPPL